MVRNQDKLWGGILSDADIQRQMERGGLVVEPLLQPMQSVSIDLRLGDEIIIPRGGRVIDPFFKVGVNDQPQQFTRFDLVPSSFVNVGTLEWVEIPAHLVGFLAGKSTLARFGLQIESAGLIDPGWKGRLTLELVNLGPDTIRLTPHMKICQMYLMPIFDRPCQNLYGAKVLDSHYQGATGPETGLLSSSRVSAKSEPAQPAESPAR